MTSVISTTNPPPPMGVTPTEVPLGISSTTSPTAGPINAPVGPLSILGLQTGVFYGSFDITIAQNTATRIFTHLTEYPLGDFNNRYNQVAGEVSTQRFLIPWQLLTAFYSKQVKIDWEITLTPIKVADCRASIDIVFKYEHDNPTTFDSRALANDSLHKHLDSQDDDFKFLPPMFWTSNNVHTDSLRYNLDGTQRVVQPAFLPCTTSEIFIRNRYQPSLLQPDTFTVLVVLNPIVRQCLGIAGKSVVRTLLPDIDDQISKPYFIRSSNT